MRKISYALVATAILVFTSCVQNDPYVPQQDSDLGGKLFINEVNGTGEDGDKYVEFYNSTDIDINLENVVLEYGGKATWKGMAADVVPAGGYFLIKGAKTAYPGMSQGLSSRNANVNLTLLDAAGNTVDYYEKVEELIGTPLETMDHMRIPDGGTWYFVEVSAQTPDAANLTNASDPAVKGAMSGVVIPPTADYSKLVLNEVDGINKSIELYNTGTEALSLEGVKIVKLADDESDWWIGTAAAGTISAGGYILLSNEIDATSPFFGDGGISPKKSVQFDLYDPAGNQLDTFLRGDASALDASIFDVSPNSYQRIPNGTGDWKLAEPTNDAANAASGTDIPQE